MVDCKIVLILLVLNRVRWTTPRHPTSGLIHTIKPIVTITGYAMNQRGYMRCEREGDGGKEHGVVAFQLTIFFWVQTGGIRQPCCVQISDKGWISGNIAVVVR